MKPTSSESVTPTTSDTKARWGQDRRLAFIDLRLQYDGKLNRRDLSNFFGISTPQASQDLAKYMNLAPENLRYDASSKTYVSTDKFCPRYGEVDARAYLNEVQALATGVLGRDQSFLGHLPPTGIVATPSRALSADVIATFVDAMRDRRSLEIDYQSMRAPTSTRRVISPHALGYDGLRWHVRAYCHTRNLFRDFAVGRARHIEPSDTPAADPAADTEWETLVPIILAPHPKLSLAQREMVEEDYGMESGGTLELICRQAMLFYTLRHLNLENKEIHSDPARQHVIVVNRAQLDTWLQDVTAL